MCMTPRPIPGRSDACCVRNHPIVLLHPRSSDHWSLCISLHGHRQTRHARHPCKSHPFFCSVAHRQYPPRPSPNQSLPSSGTKPNSTSPATSWTPCIDSPTVGPPTRHDAFRHICVSLAQKMHTAEISLRTNILGEPARHNIRPLSETKCVPSRLLCRAHPCSHTLLIRAPTRTHTLTHPRPHTDTLVHTLTPSPTRTYTRAEPSKTAPTPSPNPSSLPSPPPSSSVNRTAPRRNSPNDATTSTTSSKGSRALSSGYSKTRSRSSTRWSSRGKRSKVSGSGERRWKRSWRGWSGSVSV